MQELKKQYKLNILKNFLNAETKVAKVNGGLGATQTKTANTKKSEDKAGNYTVS